MIVKGEIKPGEKLPGERELAEQLRVGRACVREALRALLLAGIISIKPGDGTYVNKVNSQFFNDLVNTKFGLLFQKDDFLQLMEARKILESQLAKLAAERATDILFQTISMVRDLLTSYQRAVVKDIRLRSRSLEFHRKIYEYIRDHKPVEAAKTMDEHLVDVERALSNYFKAEV
ncbi:MAG: GntR family transcriptional regulator [Thermoanaerobacteraceae bacterium]|nr:GntR family transcriptional regulator [Thermoanaerobacteraceae bacterium]